MPAEPTLAALIPLAEAVLTLADELELFDDEDGDEDEDEDDDEDGEEAGRDRARIEELTRALVVKLAGAALDLAAALNENLTLLDDLHDWFGERDLAPRLLKLHWSIADAGETDRAIAVARAFGFIVPELLRGDVAIILARGGQRERALEELTHHLQVASDVRASQLQAGDVYEATSMAAAAVQFSFFVPACASVCPGIRDA